MTKLKPGFGRLATMGEALDVLFAHLPQLACEEVDLDQTLGRVLAVDVNSAIDVPHFVRAAMDGYAVVAADTFGAKDSMPIPLDVTEAVTPGRPSTERAGDGRCIEISTGAALPDGADAVVMVENTDAAGENVLIRKPVSPGENTIGVGSDIRKGDRVLRAGTVLEPRHLGALAAIGMRTAQVFAKPRVTLFSTGPELLADGAVLSEGKVFDINSSTLRAALISDGCVVTTLGVVADDLDALVDALRQAAAESDLVILSGGSSLGRGDLVAEAFSAVGSVLIHGVAVKPGKPLVLGVGGTEGHQRMMIGLPGYPMSALSDYYVFIRPYLKRAMKVTSPDRFVGATLSRKHPSAIGRYEFLPVKLEGGQAMPIGKGSSSITALSEADGFIEIEENVEVLEAGAQVSVHLF